MLRVLYAKKLNTWINITILNSGGKKGKKNEKQWIKNQMEVQLHWPM